MKRKINITIILLILTVAVTVLLFFYWTKAENRTTLFGFNLAYSIFLEILFYGFIYITRLNSKKILGATYSVLGTISFFYILLSIILILSFNIFLLNHISVKWYYTTVIIGTLITIIATGFSLKLNNSIVSQDELVTNTLNSHSNFLKELKYLEGKYNSTLSEKGITESFESGYNSVIEKLINKFKYVNPKNLENDVTQSRLSKDISTISDHITELKNTETDGLLIHKKITECTDDIINYINSLN